MGTETYEQDKAFLTERFDEARTYAQNAWDEFVDFLANMQTDFSAGSIPIADVTFPPTPPILNFDIIGERPDDPDLELDAGSPPSVPSLGSISGITVPDVPTFSITPPEVNLPTAPDATLPTDPGEAPAASEIDVPAAPVFTLPVAPTLADIIIPEAPSLDTITFEGVFPENTLDPPANLFAYDEALYQSILKDPLDAKILADIVAGGTGLDPDVEEAIYLRARSRLSEERDLAHNESANYFASKGHTLPPGALQARLTEIDRKFTNALTDINRDILIKQAELTWQNIKETITAGLSRENSLMQHADAVATRAFEVSKYAVESAILTFNASVANYNTKLEGYKAQAAVYSERIRAQLVNVEIYKASVEGKRIEAEVQQTLVAIYQSKINAIDSLIKVYNGQLQGALVQAQIDRVKLEGYQAKIQAYVAKVGAKTSEFNMYQAQIAGEVSKTALYKEQVAAYVAEVEGVKVQAEVESIELQAEVEVNKALVSEYLAEIEGYKASLSGSVAELEAQSKVYGFQVDAYRADIQAATADAQAQISQFEALVREAVSNTDLALKQAEINIQAALRSNTLQSEASKAGANVAAQIVSSALTSVNASASLGYAGGYNSTYYYDKTKGDASGPSTSNQHVWHENF